MLPRICVSHVLITVLIVLWMAVGLWSVPIVCLAVIVLCRLQGCANVMSDISMTTQQLLAKNAQMSLQTACSVQIEPDASHARRACSQIPAGLSVLLVGLLANLVGHISTNAHRVIPHPIEFWWEISAPASPMPMRIAMSACYAAQLSLIATHARIPTCARDARLATHYNPI